MNRQDEILSLLREHRPRIDDPEALAGRIMSSLPDQDDDRAPESGDVGRHAMPVLADRRRIILRNVMTAAAVLAIGLFVIEDLTYSPGTGDDNPSSRAGVGSRRTIAAAESDNTQSIYMQYENIREMYRSNNRRFKLLRMQGR